MRRLGAVGDKDTEQESLMLEFGVVYAPFGKRVMECLPEEDDKWVVPPKPRPDQGDVDVKARRLNGEIGKTCSTDRLDGLCAPSLPSRK